MSPETRKRLAHGVAGLLVSGVAIAALVRHVDLRDVAGHLAGASWGWFVLLVGAKWAVAGAKGWRWRGVLREMEPQPLSGVFEALSIGYLMNLLLPLRLGELLRVGALKRRNPDASAASALASIGAERVLDALVLALLVSAMLPFVPAPDWVRTGTPLILVAALAVAGVAMARPVHDWLASRLPPRGPGGLARRVLDAASRGTAVLRRPRALAGTAALTGAIWLGDAFTSWCGMQALGLEVGYAGALVVTLLYAIGLMIPSAPVQVGTHQALTVLFLQPFGVPADQAVSFSLLLQAGNLLTWLPWGGHGLWRHAVAGRSSVPA